MLNKLCKHLRDLKLDCLSLQISHGRGEVTLRREHLTQTFPNIFDLVGSSIYVHVSVLTESGEKEALTKTRPLQKFYLFA